MLVFILTAVVAYLLGSIPNGFLVGKWRGVDLRREGSGNIGATNAVRVLGKKWGYLVFFGDFLKGALAAWSGWILADLGGLSTQDAVVAPVIAAVLVVVGHNYPVWLGFHGGKGIATSAGAAIVLFPIWLFIAGIIIWFLLFLTTRYVSVASIGAAIALPSTSAVLLLLGQIDWLRALISLLMCGLAIFRHKENISRLIAGTEKRFERKPRATT